MKKLYSSYLFTFLILSAFLASNNYEVLASELRLSSDTTKNKSQVKESAKITDTRTNKPDFLKSGVRIKSFTPFKPVIIKSNNAPSADGKSDLLLVDDKILSNVKVYPNPVEDEINLSYQVNKDSNVTIKIMDVLGNEISTLLSQKLTAGEQTNTFNIASRLNSGFYFIRVIVGNEIVIKRISVL
jgi:hypothetical protein